MSNKQKLAIKQGIFAYSTHKVVARSLLLPQCCLSLDGMTNCSTALLLSSTSLLSLHCHHCSWLHWPWVGLCCCLCFFDHKFGCCFSALFLIIVTTWVHENKKKSQQTLAVSDNTHNKVDHKQFITLCLVLSLVVTVCTGWLLLPCLSLPMSWFHIIALLLMMQDADWDGCATWREMRVESCCFTTNDDGGRCTQYNIDNLHVWLWGEEMKSLAGTGSQGKNWKSRGGMLSIERMPGWRLDGFLRISIFSRDCLYWCSQRLQPATSAPWSIPASIASDGSECSRTVGMVKQFELCELWVVNSYQRCWRVHCSSISLRIHVFIYSYLGVVSANLQSRL